MYLYRTRIIYDADGRIGATEDTADVADFEGATKKPNALNIDSIEIAQTTFFVSKTYAQFGALVDGTTITWADVKYEDSGRDYILYLASETQF